MKAISLSEPRHIKVIDIPEPQMGPEDVLVDIRFIGLCGTDLNSYRGRLALLTYPRIPGHEVSGVIVAKGQAVPDGVKVGSQVTFALPAVAAVPIAASLTKR